MGFHSGFHDITESASLLASGDKFRAGINSQEYELSARAGRHQFLDGVNSIHSWHSNIYYNNVWIEALYLCYKRYPVACCPYEFKLRAQKTYLGFEEFLMVIGQEYARANQCSPPS